MEVDTFRASRSSVHEKQAGFRRKIRVLEHKGLWRRYAVFFRQLLILQREPLWRLLLKMWHKCATSENGGDI